MVKTFAKILLVNDRGEILYLRRSDDDDHRPGGPDFPGGTMDRGEDPHDGLIREVREETGLEVTDIELVYATPRTGAYGTGTLLIYMARIPSDAPIRLSDEHTSFEWLTPEAALTKTDYPNHRELFQFIIDHHVLNPASPKGVTCRALLTNDAGGLLVLRRSATDPFHAGTWDLPGGRMEPGERLLDTVIRETEEECGLRDLSCTLVYGTANPRREGTGTWLFYRAHVPADAKILLSYEHDGYKWIPAADLPKYTDYEVLTRMHGFMAAHGLYSG